MENWHEQKCVACREGAPPVEPQQLANFLRQHPQWSRVVEAGVNKLQQVYSFTSYQNGLLFTQALAELAEAEDHHPCIILEWRKVTVVWWTHKIKGLHANDLIMAAKTDEVAARLPS